MYVEQVNLLQGTESEKRYSRGNTLPLIQRPFGMASFSLQTNGTRGNWFYHPKDCSLEGIRLTHQPSPWMGDYGQVLFLPHTGKIAPERENRYSSYREKDTVLEPSYLEVLLNRYQVKAKLVPTERCAVLDLSFVQGGKNRLSICSDEKEAIWEMNEQEKVVCGCLSICRDGAPENFKEYIYLKFDCSIEMDEETYLDQQGINPCLLSDKVSVSIGTSFISMDQAKLNVEFEIGEKTFEQLYQEGNTIWENYLGKIQVEGEKSEKETFYSSFYRCFLYPRTFYELEADGSSVHISMKDGSKKQGVFYTDNGFWDTFRTLYPLFSILIPEKLKEILIGYLNFYKDTGWLPKWLSPGERGTMPGTLIDAVLADGIVKDILSKEEALEAYDAMKKHADCEAQDMVRGRFGVKDYHKFGYLPYTNYKESVSNTLDYMYGDFCIAKVGEKLLQEDAGHYLKNAMQYKKLFHPQYNFFIAKDENGNWKEDFDEYTWGEGYCEGGAWQCGFGVCFDLEGWAELFPNDEKRRDKINELFEKEPVFKIGSYPCEIHEMTEMNFADFGQCAISNQPSFLLPYYPALLGDIIKTEKMVGKILREGFSADNFPGDEDNGSMAAWYVLSSIGIYPYCPGIAEYLLVPTIWKSVVITLSNGNKVQFNQDSTKKYRIEKTIISHKELMKRGRNLSETI